MSTSMERQPTHVIRAEQYCWGLCAPSVIGENKTSEIQPLQQVCSCCPTIVDTKDETVRHLSKVYPKTATCYHHGNVFTDVLCHQQWSDLCRTSSNLWRHQESIGHFLGLPTGCLTTFFTRSVDVHVAVIQFFVLMRTSCSSGSPSCCLAPHVRIKWKCETIHFSLQQSKHHLIIIPMPKAAYN